MRHKIANYDEVIQKLRTFLPQYLAEHGIDTARPFCCINPDHDDHNPSMSCLQNPENAYCFSCGCTANIFTAANWLENKPNKGPGFLEDTIPYLANKFGVEIELEEMDEDEIYRLRTYRAYADAAALIANPDFGDYTQFNEEIERRGWDKTKLANMGVGTVIYKDFREAMKSMGYEAGFQNEIDLGRADLFHENAVIFTICDEFGRPVGFAARNLGDGAKSKYTNQRTTGVRCNIYQKSRRLYRMHEAKEHIPPLYIFEGYTDTITANLAGLINCVGIGGTAFTQQHINLLKTLGIYDICLVLDGDQAGRAKTSDLLDKYFSGNQDTRVHIVNIPDDGDPDSFIREYGLEEFLKLKKHTAFEWRLTEFKDDDDPEEICQIMIPLIVNEQNRITQDKMCKVLADFTGFEKRVIAAELERLQNKQEYIKQRETNAVMDRLQEDVKLNPGNAKALLYECISNIEQIEERMGAADFAPESVVTYINDQKDYEESLSGEFAGFFLKDTGLKGWGDKLANNWKQDTFMCISGVPNCGKTALSVQLLYEIVDDERNDAIGIYHTIDDSKAQILPRFICQAYGQTDLELNMVRNPNYFKTQVDNPEKMLWARNKGYKKVLQYAREGKLILKGVTEGYSMAYGESLIRHLRDKYPDKNIVYVLDNFHKASDFKGQETRQRFTSLSNYAKDIANRYQVCMICTVELTKLPPGTIPTDTNIAETRAIMYDALFTGHLFNDIHDKGPMAEYVHEHEGEMLPRVMMNIGKNKISDYKGVFYFDMFPASGLYHWVPNVKAEADRAQRREDNKAVKVTQQPGRVIFTEHDGDNSWPTD